VGAIDRRPPEIRGDAAAAVRTVDVQQGEPGHVGLERGLDDNEARQYVGDERSQEVRSAGHDRLRELKHAGDGPASLHDRTG
jgi:hypothetical protein